MYECIYEEPHTVVEHFSRNWKTTNYQHDTPESPTALQRPQSINVHNLSTLNTAAANLRNPTFQHFRV